MWLANFNKSQCSLQEIQYGILLADFGLHACSQRSLLHMWIININVLPYLLTVLHKNAAVLSVQLLGTWIVSPWISCIHYFPCMGEEGARFCRAGQFVCGRREQNLVLTREEMLGADYCKPGELCEKPSLLFGLGGFLVACFSLIKHYWVSFPSKTTTNGVLCPVYAAETRHQMGHPSPEPGESLFQMAKWNIAKYACKVFEHSVTDSQNKQGWGKSRINNSWGKAAFLWMLQPCSSLCLRRSMEVLVRAGNKTKRL